MPGRIETSAGRAGRLLPWAAALAAAGLLAVPLFTGYAPALPPGDDTIFAVHAAQGFAEALGDGVAYPRWIERSNRGLGAPIFLFYSPLAYYVAGAATLATGDVLAGLRWSAVLFALLSGLAFVFAFRDRAAPPAVAAGAALYVLAPYHVLDLYWRFAFAEFASFVWLPLLFRYARRAVEGRGADGVPGLALAYGGLVATHVVSAFLAPFVLGPYVAVRLLRSGRWVRLAPAVGAGALGLALAGVYVIPMAAQRDAVRLDAARDADYADYRRHFVLSDATPDGAPPPGITPHVDRSAVAQALLSAVALAGLVPVLRRRSRAAHEDAPRAAHEDAARVAHEDAARAIDEAWALAAVAVFTLGIQLAVAAVLWRVVPELPRVQFPWRFQGFQALVACLLATDGLAARLATGGRAARRRAAPWAAAFAAAAAAGLWAGAQAHREPGRAFRPESVHHPLVRYYAVPEYLPRDAPPIPGLHARARGRPPRARLDGPGRVAVLEWRAHERALRVEADRAARLRIRTFAYPGWRARLDGRPVEIGRAPQLGEIAIDVPAGVHQVRLDFESTPDRTAGAATSAAAAIVWLGLVAWRRAHRARPDAR